MSESTNPEAAPQPGHMCPFYGRHATQMFGLVEGGKNQCAIIVDSYTPCFMEVWEHMLPDATTCHLLHAASGLRETLERQARQRAAYKLEEEPGS